MGNFKINDLKNNIHTQLEALNAQIQKGKFDVEIHQMALQCLNDALKIIEIFFGNKHKKASAEEAFLLKNQGFSNEEIEKKLNITKSTLHRYIRLFVPKDKKLEERETRLNEIIKLKNEGLTYATIAEKLNLHLSTVSKYIRSYCGKGKRGRRNYVNYEEILNLKKQGMTHANIAQRLDISISTVNRCIRAAKEK